MKILPQLSDGAILAELGTRLTQARLRRNLTQQQLATAAGVAKRTVERIEAGHSNQLSNLIRVFRALGAIEQLNALLPEPPPSPIEQLEQRKQRRRRASSRKSKTGSTRGGPRPWTWDDQG
ncbi:MAG TPA: helix-turn-helix transcriptional regulator [Gammaproteobacteria bacterium]|nr:helix-turn-helix transcriptional regulator [Gammaproteobacteria bacterium]